ncbi:MAG: hypothetical protein QME64_11305, partial [bacterium]|nr:hypothetical protein [bacterium]
EKELKLIVAKCARTEKEQAPLADAIEIEYRTGRQLLLSLLSANGWIFYDPIGYLNKGRIIRDYVNYHREVLSVITTKSYSNFTQIDWVSKIPKYFITQMIMPNYSAALTRNIAGKCRLRLAQVQSAIQLYRLEKKSWPKALDDLKPYLSPIPVDPFTDKPFFWATDFTGRPFAYSVGPDFINNSAQVLYDPSNGTTSSGDIRP